MAMNASEMRQGGDLVLAPGEYAYLQDTTKGMVSILTGPTKVSMSNTDQPVVWDSKERRFKRVDAKDAIQIESVAPEGFYVALYNPADQQPRSGTMAPAAPMNIGHRVNIPGPVNFALWPGQFARVIPGHHLHSNQYLLAQVYNDVEASKNWKEAVVRPQTSGDSPTGEGQEPAETPALPAPRSFTPGQLLIIKGTEVSFFIPPTGIKVVPEADKKFVREAVTLERLEYCILLDEDGNKRFVQGPSVVFPEPTEQFVEKDGSRKFRAIELNETTGLYIKVIADYEEDGVKYKAGDERFITGKNKAIYIQREEDSVIRYDGQTKHYAVAIPAGEGRYVLNRTTGVITLVRGPRMLLCDPRTEVIILRTLSERAVKLMYPGNDKVLAINREREVASMAKTEGASQYEASFNMASMPMASPAGTVGARGLAALNYQEEVAYAKSRQVAGETFQRGTKFTPPRTITLDTKYDGAVAVNVWTGYAVLIVDKTGHRKVVVGPANILLEYDETLAPLGLSTGTPKTTAKLLETVYLLVRNNRVSDIVEVETKDLVRIKLNVAYRVNFEGDNPERWFEVENYIQLLSDHMRSLIRNTAKRKGVEEFYTNAIDIIRDAVLGENLGEGKPRAGRAFAENNMRVYDLEVLEVGIMNPQVAQLLVKAQMSAIETTLKSQDEERLLEYTKRSELTKRKIQEEKTTTVEENSKAAIREVTAVLEGNLTKLRAEMDVEKTKLSERQAQQDALDQLNNRDLARRKSEADQTAAIAERKVEVELKRILGETDEIVKRAKAVDPNLATALMAFSDQELIGKISTALAPMAAMNGVSAADILAKLFHGTPFEGVMKTLGERTRMPVQANG